MNRKTLLYAVCHQAVTGRVRVVRREDGSAALILDGEERGPVEWH